MIKPERTEREIIEEAYSDEARALWLAPVQVGRGGKMYIPWDIHLEAYEAYCKKWSHQTALIDLKGRGCRGGFGTEELDGFVPGWRDRVSAIAKMETRLAELENRPIEEMGEALAMLGGLLKDADFLDKTVNYVAWERIAKLWSKFQ